MAAQSRTVESGKNDTSQRILASAFKCISTKGCASVSLRDIADEAGVALSQLNYYYGNREQLFAAVLQSIKQEYVSNVETRMAAFNTLNEKARCLIQYNQELLQTNKRFYGAFVEFFGLAMWSKSFKKEVNGFINDISNVIENQIHSLTTKEEVSPSYSPAALTAVIMGTTLGLAMQYLMDPESKTVLSGFDLLLKTFEPTTEKN